MISEETDNATNGLMMSSYLKTVVMPLSQYNAITGQSAELTDNEAMAFLNSGEAFGGGTLELFGKAYTPVKPPETFPICGQVSANIAEASVLVIPDYEAFLARIDLTQRLENSRTAYCADLGDMTDAEQSAYFADMYEAGWDSVFTDEDFTGGWSMECRVDNERDVYAMYGSFLFMGIALGLLFTMAAVLIIYYKQISEGLDDKTRFSIMRKVGLSQSEAKRSIHSQILTVFFPAADHRRHPHRLCLPDYQLHPARDDASAGHDVRRLHRRHLRRVCRVLCDCLRADRQGLLPDRQRELKKRSPSFTMI